MEIDEAYKGREHSYIKHELLRGYLEKLLFIKGMSGCNKLAYVDCFAGPWGDESDDLHATSIAISLHILKRVRDGLAANGKYVSMKAIYIEKDDNSYNKLCAYLDSNTPAGVDAVPIHGDYSENISRIIDNCRGYFTFFFVDPKQWTPIAIPKLSSLLSRDDSEFVINFMYDFINRALSQKKLRESICALLGPLDENEINVLCSQQPKDREQAVVRRYRDALKEKMRTRINKIPRSYHATVLDKDKDRTKYHLVYLTSHSKGIVEFAKLSENTTIVQRKVHFETKQSKSGMDDMFGLDDATVRKLDSADINEVKQYWMNKLSPSYRVYNEDDLADMLEETDWLVSDFERAFQELLSEGKAQNQDAKRKRPKHPIKFEKGERLRRCI